MWRSYKLFLAVGVIFHCVFIMSIFDIYFVSPLVHGMQPVPERPGKAQRLFLMVADGLRLDVCLGKLKHPRTQEVAYLSPWLREKVKTEATFGISHTRVPTESRPGHVALIAGFYEDVSAVTKGWKENPVEYDSTFNRSRHTWAWGSPDIVPMFVKGADPGKVTGEWYPREMQDFTQDTRQLDTYVFEKFAQLLEDSKTNATLYKQLHEDKIIFFLHLLGLDTAGHASRPHSPEYYDNMIYLNEMLPKLEKMVNDYYQDDKTAWLFTADHGITAWGAHGDGHPDNTRTPFIAWGAGVASPKPLSDLSQQDAQVAQWELPVEEHDVAQADATPLMAQLLGLSFPVNSVGRVPVEYLEGSPQQKFEAISLNVKAMREQYEVKAQEVASRQLWFTPYKFNGVSIEERLDNASQLMSGGRSDEAIEEMKFLFRELEKGLLYLQRYNWVFLRTLVASGYIGWMAYALTVLMVSDASTPTLDTRVLLSSIGCLALLSTAVYFQGYPARYQAYVVFPVLFWAVVIQARHDTKRGLMRLFQNFAHPGKVAAWTAAAALIFLELIVVGYFYRAVYTLVTILLGLWPLLSRRGPLTLTTIGWALSCFAMSTFTVLDPIKTESLLLINAGSLLVIIASLSLLQDVRSAQLSQTVRWGLYTQTALVGLITVVTNSTVRCIRLKEGLPYMNQFLGWSLVILSAVIPAFYFFSIHDHRYRVLSLFLGCAPIMVILCISYEMLFYVAYSAMLYAWQSLESENRQAQKDKTSDFSVRDFRCALAFFYLFQLGFFGTGNIASISAFSLDSVYRLLPVFQPMAMTALLMLKLIIPFVLASVALGVISIRSGMPPALLVAAVLTFCDILTLNFFFMVRTEGSWMEIGTSISHFFIASFLCAVMVTVQYGVKLLMSGVSVTEKTKLVVA